MNGVTKFSGLSFLCYNKGAQFEKRLVWQCRPPKVFLNVLRASPRMFERACFGYNMVKSTTETQSNEMVVVLQLIQGYNQLRSVAICISQSGRFLPNWDHAVLYLATRLKWVNSGDGTLFELGQQGNPASVK